MYQHKEFRHSDGEVSFGLITDALQRTMLIQNQWKQWHGKFIKQNQFNAGDWELLFESRFKKFSCLTGRWLNGCCNGLEE